MHHDVTARPKYGSVVNLPLLTLACRVANIQVISLHFGILHGRRTLQTRTHIQYRPMLCGTLQSSQALYHHEYPLAVSEMKSLHSCCSSDTPVSKRRMGGRRGSHGYTTHLAGVSL